MAIATGSNYIDTSINNILEEKLRWVFDFAFHENKEFQQLDAVKTISGWHKEIKEYKEKKQHDGDNKHAIISSIANRTIDELIKYVKPYYIDSIIKGIGINTHFKEGSVELNCNIEFISIRPFVKFVKQVDGQEFTSAKFRFQIDSSIHINKLQIKSDSASPHGKTITIDKIGIELKLTLLDVIISSVSISIPLVSLDKPIKLVSKKFEIKSLLLQVDRPVTTHDKSAALNLIASGGGQKSQLTIACQKCGNEVPSSFKFCNACGSSIT